MEHLQSEHPSVLITGASVAGPAAAYWLAEAGYQVTVLEESSGLREGGQNIDVRGTAREVLRLMGLEEAVRSRNTGEMGTRFVDEQGDVVSEFPVGDGTGHDGPTAELEILRGALAHVLMEACPADVRWWFGDRISSVRQGQHGVDVELASGASHRFDLLVIAEGVGSHTRELVFGSEPDERELGMYVTFGTIPRTSEDDDWWRALVAPGGRQVSLRPDDEGTMRAMLNFRVATPVLADLDMPGLRSALRERFADAGWETPRILDGLDSAEDLYVDWLRQVVCPRWHQDRVVLLGDAGWCVTPIGGGGTSLAITGAYVLAAFLSQAGAGAHGEAFSRYEEWMRPLVEKAQDLPPGTPRIATPETRAGVQALRWGSRIAASTVVSGLASRLTSGPEAERDLPDLARASR